MVISSNQYTSACEELAGHNAVRLHNRSDLINIIDLFKSGEINKAKDVIESEPRIILDSWDNYMKGNKVIKKDFKAEKRLVTKK
jgi:restriction system protein